MKAVFPCKGVIVLTKKDVQKLEEFYQNALITSKEVENLNTSEFMIQIDNLNYLPPKTQIIANENYLLTISNLRSIMNNSTVVANTSTQKIIENSEKPLSDDDILSHPFFTTLKPID